VKLPPPRPVWKTAATLRYRSRLHAGRLGVRTIEEYERSSYTTIRQGRTFTYYDRGAQADRVGYFDRATHKFTAVTEDGTYIVTHFRADTASYARRLPRSTY
jgi:hypothetical protein